MNFRFKIFKKKVKKNCITCRFNCGMHCSVGTYYTEKGLNKICYEGELWEEK